MCYPNKTKGSRAKYLGSQEREGGVAGNEANIETTRPEHWVKILQGLRGTERGTFSIPALKELKINSGALATLERLEAGWGRARIPKSI